MTHISKQRYSKLFTGAIGETVGYLPMSGNTGDRLIDYAAARLFTSFKIAFKLLRVEDLDDSDVLDGLDRIYVAGGGNMGSLYPQCRVAREKALQTGLPVTVLPQSFTDADESIRGFEQVWVRERSSLRRKRGTRLAPDLALCLELPPMRARVKSRLGLFLRTDTEALFADFDKSLGDPVVLCLDPAEYIALAACYRHIVTDRLHFAIAALLLDREVTLLPNSYSKNRSMWQTWLKALGCQWADTPGNVMLKRRRSQRIPLPEVRSVPLADADTVAAASGWSLVEVPQERGPASDPFRLEHPAGGYRFSIDTSTAHLWSRISADPQRQYPVDQIPRNIVKDKSTDAATPAKSLALLFRQGAVQIRRRGAGPERHTKPWLGGRHGVPIRVEVHEPIEMDDMVYRHANIFHAGERHGLWYRTPTEFAPMVDAFADCFVLAMLFPAMAAGVPLWIQGAPISEGLLDNLERLQTIWSLWYDGYSRIAVEADTAPRATAPGHALLSFSGGVDSSFSLYHHQLSTATQRPIAIKAAVMTHGFDIPIGDDATWQNAFARATRITDDARLPLIPVSTNLREFDQNWQLTHGAAMAASLAFLSNRARYGLLPSTLDYAILYPWGSTPLTDHLLGSDRFQTFCDGAGLSRVEKIRVLRDWPAALNNLRYCWQNQSHGGNCGKCSKCVITAAMIRATDAGKQSLQPFPTDRQLAARLRKARFGKLDRHDFRNEMARLRGLSPRPQWVKALLEKLEV